MAAKKPARKITISKKGSSFMPHSITRITLTPSEAAEKALIVDQLRANPRGPWVNGKKTNLAASKGSPAQNDNTKK
jgi:hypothetical protein